MADVDNLQQQEMEFQPDSPRLSPPPEGVMQKFRLYETRSNFYMVGRDKSRTYWKILKIDRSEPWELNIREDCTTYTGNQCSDLLRRIHEGNKATGGLKFITICYGIVGFIKFLGPYYMLLITKRRQIGVICGHSVYGISKTELVPLVNPSVRSSMVEHKNENRYKKLLCMVDLTKDFYFSYSYHVMRSLQKNMCDSQTGQVLYETMFVWNEFLTRGIRNMLQNTIWTVALVYGFFKQAKISISGRDLKLTLIARRSRHYAGTRYLKRGVNEKGRVANDVETEQIVVEDASEGLPIQVSSVVQHRGSIPLFWSQETSRLNIKPDIILSKRDQSYQATRLHFENLAKRYGNPIIILNLIKTNERKPRELILRQEFANAIEVINEDLPEENKLKFLHWDLNKHSRSYFNLYPKLLHFHAWIDTNECLFSNFISKTSNVLVLLGRVAAYALTLTGFFYCQVTPELLTDGHIKWPRFENIAAPDMATAAYFHADGEKHNDDENEDSDSSDRKSIEGNNSNTDSNPPLKPPMVQNGVLRTNCIDCLDRTNVAQYAYGLAALGHQLRALGVTNSKTIDLDDPLAEELMSLYEKMGDTLAHQYGGSAAHNKWKAATQSQELFRTLQRYYSNAYIDAEKQNAIIVFLGHFQPQLAKPEVWELDSDQHYGVGRNIESTMDLNQRSPFRRSWSDGNILRKSQSPTSASDILTGAPSVEFTIESREGNKMLSELTSDISSSENELSYSSCIPTVPTRELFAEMRKHRLMEHESRDRIDCSNFVDIDWISSSGNSCEEELLESLVSMARSNAFHVVTSLRSMPSASSITVLSSEINEMAGEAHTSECGSSTRGREHTGTDLYSGEALDHEVLEEYSDSFVRWVTSGETLCH